MTLNEFLCTQRAALLRFEKYWRRRHAENPAVYPLDLGHENGGLWWEMLQEMPEETDERSEKL